MLVRNISDQEVLETTYRAHGGAIAPMVLDRRNLKDPVQWDPMGPCVQMIH